MSIALLLKRLFARLLDGGVGASFPLAERFRYFASVCPTSRAAQGRFDPFPLGKSLRFVALRCAAWDVGRCRCVSETTPQSGRRQLETTAAPQHTRAAWRSLRGAVCCGAGSAEHFLAETEVLEVRRDKLRGDWEVVSAGRQRPLAVAARREGAVVAAEEHLGARRGGQVLVMNETGKVVEIISILFQPSERNV
jgi:hypothetical protein